MCFLKFLQVRKMEFKHLGMNFTVLYVCNAKFETLSMGLSAAVRSCACLNASCSEQEETLCSRIFRAADFMHLRRYIGFQLIQRFSCEELWHILTDRITFGRYASSERGVSKNVSLLAFQLAISYAHCEKCFGSPGLMGHQATSGEGIS